MNYTQIEVERDGPITVIRFNRPEKMNCIGLTTHEELVHAWNQFRDEDGPATATGGDGSDTFDARVWNGFGGEADDIYLHITDFDVDEDVLQVGVFQTDNEVAGVEVIEADGGTHTDVRVTYTGRPGTAPGIAIIRLDGTPGITADHIVITT